MKRILMGLMLIVVMVSATGCYSTPDGGNIGVVRNGGPFDNKNIRGIVCNGSGNTWVGWGSSTHYYPVKDQQRIYKLDTSEDADAKPPLVRTKDGVNARISGTFYINTSFDCSNTGKELLKKFDTQFGTRTFGTHGNHPYESFGDFLNAVVQPVIDSNMREIIAEFECKQLVSSCTLVQRGAPANVDPNVTNNKSNVQQIQDRVQAGLTQDLNAKLGQPYFTDIKFNLQPVELPEVDNAIGQAQAAFADVSKVQAQVQKERAQVDIAHQKYLANVEKQKGYNACHSCARQDELRSLPNGLNTLVFGSGGSPIAIGK